MHRPDAGAGIRAIHHKFFNAGKFSVRALGLQFASNQQRLWRRIQCEAARSERRGHFQVHREGFLGGNIFRKRAGRVELAVTQLRGVFSRRRAMHARRVRGDGVGVRLRRGKREHRDVLKLRVRRHELARKILRASDVRFRNGNVAHRLVGPHPRPAGLAPAGAVEHPDVDADAPALADGVVNQLPPLLGKDFGGAAIFIIHVHVTDERLAEAELLHRFEVARDACLGNIVADPIPVAPGLGGFGRVGETISERFGAGQQNYWG